MDFSDFFLNIRFIKQAFKQPQSLEAPLKEDLSMI